MHLLSLILVTLLGGEPAIDDFRYVDAASARTAWVAGEASPPVEVVEEDRPVMRLKAPFATQSKLRRVVVDRRVQLDLNASGGFELEAAIDDPQSIGSLTLYFRSGDGWYSASSPVAAKGWQTFRFAKTSFGTEGTPAGWGKIDGIRLAFWRAPGAEVRDSAVRVRRLAATWQPIVFVLPGKKAFKNESEHRSVRDVVRTIAALLEGLGLGADELEEDAVSIESLGQRRLVILPNNPTLSNGCAEALTRFVGSGGKLIVCYALPSRLGATLGFGNPKWVGQQRPGQFAEMRFEADDIAGLPKSVRQASWNITAAEPAGQGARVIGRWYDDAGHPTGHAAMLLSDRGAFLSHVMLSDDPNGKRRLLAAVLGHLDPSLWKQMAQAELDRADHVGHCSSLDEMARYVKKASPAAVKQFDEAQQTLERAKRQFGQGDFVATAELARAAHDALAKAYLVATPSLPHEGRAMWNHSGTGVYPGDWDRSAKLLAQNGFNMILPNMLWGGSALYASDLLPRSAAFTQYGDQIEQCCAAAKKHGLEVHVWKVNYNLGTAPKEFVEKLRREGRTQVTVKGEPFDWLCPSHPENQKLERESMLEVVRKYPVDGLHFDYIRYPGPECCYCEGCRGRFEAESGRKVSDWPKECHSGARKEEYNNWRCRQITNLVAAVSREARQLRSGLKISAAVFGSYPSCREWVAQDWVAWVKAGYLDFLCPMDYSASDAEFSSLVRNQMKLIDGRVPLYPGIGATATGIALTADRVVGQIQQARSLGAAGFTIFNLEPGTAASIVPGVGLGVGAERAIPPHRTP
jgi:uncharacterized lipoprotein YddW (UPF0748 family)